MSNNAWMNKSKSKYHFKPSFLDKKKVKKMVESFYTDLNLKPKMIEEIILEFLKEKMPCYDRISSCYLKTIFRRLRKKFLNLEKPF